MSGICKPVDNCKEDIVCTSNSMCGPNGNCNHLKSSTECKKLVPGCCQWIPKPRPSPGAGPSPPSGPGFNQICKMLEKEVDIECKELKKMLPNYNSCKKIPEKSLFVNTLTVGGCDSKTANSIYDKLNNCFCKKLSTGEIIGIVIGSLVGLGLIIFLSVYFTKKNKKA